MLMLQWGRGGKASEIWLYVNIEQEVLKLQWGRGGKASEIKNIIIISFHII